MFARITVALLVGLIWNPTLLHAQSSRPSHRSVRRFISKWPASVVYIEVGTLLERTGSGSGFILHADGYIATAAHLIEHADIVRVTFHDETFCTSKDRGDVSRPGLGVAEG